MPSSAGGRGSRRPHRSAQLLRSQASTDDVRRGATMSHDSIERHRPAKLPSDPLQRAQLLREFEARAGAYHGTRLAWTKAQRDGDPMRVKAARSLARNSSRPLAEYIEAEAQNAKGKRGPKNRWQSIRRARGRCARLSHRLGNPSRDDHAALYRWSQHARSRDSGIPSDRPRDRDGCSPGGMAEVEPGAVLRI